MAAISDILATINKCLKAVKGKSDDGNTSQTLDGNVRNNEGNSDEQEETSTLVDPPNGGLRAWLIVVSCSAINFLVGVMEPVVGFALLSSEKDNGIDEDTLTEMYLIYLSLSSIYAPVASISMVTLGYELTIHVGSWCLAVSFFILSFINNVHGIKFLLYVTAGVGSSFIKFGVLIPVLEYFSTKRIRALMFTKISRYSGQIIPLIIYLTGATPSWQSLYRICIGMSIPIGLIGLTIPSLKLDLKKSGRKCFSGTSLGLVKMEILKSVHLWLVCFLFFTYQIGTDSADVKLTDTEMPQRFSNQSRAGIVLYSLSPIIGLITGAFVGWLFKFSVGRKFYCCLKQIPTTKDLFNIILLLMVGIPFVMAVMCFIAAEVSNLPYFVIFSVLFNTQSAFIEELRDDMIPEVFGRQNVKFVEGLIQMFIGIAGIIATESAVDLYWKDSFRMAGGMFFATAVVALFFLLLQSDIGARVLKIQPLCDQNTRDFRGRDDASATISESETSEIYVTPTSGQVTEMTEKQTLNEYQNASLEYESKTTNGPSNIRFVIPRRNRMYGSRESTMTSSSESVESESLNSVDPQSSTNATGHTIYTDLQDSRSPDIYGKVQTFHSNVNSAHGRIAQPSQYVYSYNITQTIDNE